MVSISSSWRMSWKTWMVGWMWEISVFTGAMRSMGCGPCCQCINYYHYWYYFHYWLFSLLIIIIITSPVAGWKGQYGENMAYTLQLCMYDVIFPCHPWGSPASHEWSILSLCVHQCGNVWGGGWESVWHWEREGSRERVHSYWVAKMVAVLCHRIEGCVCQASVCQSKNK